MEKGSMKAKSPQPLQKRLASKQNMCSLWKKGFWRWPRQECGSLWKKGLQRFLNSAGILWKQDIVFLLGRQPPQKEWAFGKKAVAPLDCRPAERSLVHITRWSSKKRAWVGKGMWATSNVFGEYPPIFVKVAGMYYEIMFGDIHQIIHNNVW